jgi:hypothetical protein
MLDAGTTVGHVEAVPCNPQSSAPITCHNKLPTLLYCFPSHLKRHAMHTRPRLGPDTPHPLALPAPLEQQSTAEQAVVQEPQYSTVQYNTVQPHPHPLAPQVVPRFRRCNQHLTSDHQASASMHDTRTCMLQHGTGCGHVELGRGKTRLKWCAHRLPWARAPRLERGCSVAGL